MNPATNYRDMLREELAPFRVRSDEDIVRVLIQSWIQADANARGWTEAERAVRLLWSALGLLAFGRLDYLERALSIIRDRPDVVRDRACMYYVSALRTVLPVPSSLSPVNEPRRALDWLEANRSRLRWDEESGSFVVQPIAEPTGSGSSLLDQAVASAWPDEVLSLLERTLGDELRDDDYAIAG
jgi:hypothetical protein